jgi:hypothetical protein
MIDAGRASALLRTFPGATAMQIDERGAARMARQSILTRENPVPPMAWFLVDEAALRRCIGSALIMAEQLEHLLTAAGPLITARTYFLACKNGSTRAKHGRKRPSRSACIRPASRAPILAAAAASDLVVVTST